MRYQRLRYRYAVVLTAQGPRPLGDAWRAERIVLAQPVWRPPTDVYETAATITVTVELAGVDEDELDVLLFEDAVVVEGERRLSPDGAAGVYHAAEIRQGRFRIEVPLPTRIDSEQVAARYERGILQMTFPKADGR